GGQFVYNGPGAAQILGAAVQGIGAFNRSGGGGGQLQLVLNAKQKALQNQAAPFAGCKPPQSYQDDPFEVDTNSSACTLTQKGRNGPINPNLPNALQRAQNASSKCRESVEADWNYAITLQQICLQNGGLNAATLPAAQEKAAQAAQQSMH